MDILITNIVDVVLQDFCLIVGTVSKKNIHKSQWFRNVFNQQVGSLGTCSSKEVDLPWKTRASSCTVPQTPTPTPNPTPTPTETKSGSSMVYPSFFMVLLFALWNNI